MGGLVEGNETYIRRLRVSSNERDTLSLRLRVNSVLESADLQPAGLPASAVVCIRHLHVSGSVRFDLTDTRMASAWQAAVAKSIDQMVMRAARPALAAVPSDAPAVVFLDRAELLACMASDWCDGVLPTRWWWQGLLRNDFTAQIVRDSWKGAPEYVPAAMARLARNQKATAFMLSWSRAESLALLQDLIKIFALHELRPVVAFLRDANSADESPVLSASPTPLQRWAPESDAAGLEVGQQLLLNICLLLQRVPAIVRTADFAQAIMKWCRPESASPVSEVEGDRISRDDRAEARSTVIARPAERADSTAHDLRVSAHNRDKDSNVAQLSAERSVTPHFTPGTMPSADSLKAELRPDPSATANRVSEKPTTTKPAEVILSSQSEPITESSSETLFDHEPNNLTHNSRVNQELEPKAASDSAVDYSLLHVEQIETQFGGLFYLINLGLYLNLYGDFTTPATPGIDLNIWDFVALVGEELIGSNDDPIWSFLARLAGHEPDQAPGEQFAPDDNWRVAPEWLTHFSSSEPWQWSARDRRLRLLHPAGFLVFDVPLDSGDPADQLREEIGKYESVLQGSLHLTPATDVGVSDDSQAVNRKVSPEVGTWLSRLMPYIGARIRAALDLAPEDDLASFVCRRFARVNATDTHVEVFFGLADLPLEIRLAGLDRDPGWVPAAGRFIAFHFD